jgi:hypothetical protein
MANINGENGCNFGVSQSPLSMVTTLLTSSSSSSSSSSWLVLGSDSLTNPSEGINPQREILFRARIPESNPHYPPEGIDPEREIVVRVQVLESNNPHPHLLLVPRG